MNEEEIKLLIENVLYPRIKAYPKDNIEVKEALIDLFIDEICYRYSEIDRNEIRKIVNKHLEKTEQNMKKERRDWKTFSGR